MQQGAAQKVATVEQELTKARYQEARTQLVAPVDGTVQQLAIHTVGGVVTPAQALMVIVPDDQPVEIEALLPNKDIGFVHSGQKVKIKIETYPFTRFGMLEGEVISVSGDAIEDERQGRVYGSRIRLNSDHLLHAGRKFPVSPGMNVTVEVRTDQRLIIDYFLSPLLQYGDESFRER